MALRDRVLGEPERLDPGGLRRGVRFGSEPFAARCLRELGARGVEEGFLRDALGAPSAGIRRAAAGALSLFPEPSVETEAALKKAFSVERTEEGLLVLGIAWARAGGDVRGILETLERRQQRTVMTSAGPRCPSGALGLPPLTERFEDGWGGGQPVEVLRRLRRAGMTGTDGRGAREALLSLASLRHPEDFLFLQRLGGSAGRRGEHALLLATGILGDPRALPACRDALTATDVDPGRGFAQRRLSAITLGRLGFGVATRHVVAALTNEALDYEGRPGAGLGIQFPVRSNLLWALGEIVDPKAIPVLVSYLGNTHGSALGGFYLPAMGALCNYGALAWPALRSVVAGAEELPAANAVGVLIATGADVRPYATDARALVAAMMPSEPPEDAPAPSTRR